MLQEFTPYVPTFNPQNPPRTGTDMRPGGDDGLLLRFYEHPLTGKTHYEIRFPGDKLNVIDEVVDDEAKRRFRDAWKRYEAGLEARPGEEPVEHVPWISPGTARDMIQYGIPTIEALADLTDTVTAASEIRGLSDYRARARQYLDERRAAADSRRRAEENAALTKRIEALEAENARLRKPQRQQKTA